MRKTSGLATESTHVQITHGEYSNNEWYGIGGIENPIYKLIIARILTEIEFLDEYELFVHGGILEDWITWDIDFYMTGPYDPVKIKSILSTISKIGFEEQLICDPSYQQGGWFDHYDMEKEDKSSCYLTRRMETDKEMRSKGLATEILYHTDRYIVSTEVYDTKYLTLPNGLFRKGGEERRRPESLAKHMDRLATGYKYNWPLKIN